MHQSRKQDQWLFANATLCCCVHTLPTKCPHRPYLSVCTQQPAPRRQLMYHCPQAQSLRQIVPSLPLPTVSCRLGTQMTVNTCTHMPKAPTEPITTRWRVAAKCCCLRNTALQQLPAHCFQPPPLSLPALFKTPDTHVRDVKTSQASSPSSNPYECVQPGHITHASKNPQARLKTARQQRQRLLQAAVGVPGLCWALQSGTAAECSRARRGRRRPAA